MPKEKLTDQQERFCQEYMKDLNGTQAAIRAGYAKNSAQEQSSRLLSKDMVQHRLESLMNKRAKKTGITAERVLKELASIAFANMGDVATWNESGVTFKESSELSSKQMASVAEVVEHTNSHGGSLKIRQHDKVKALELLGKHLKLYTDKTEHSGGLTLEQLLMGEKPEKEEET
jgi:phage terminase small subunit